ncbi:MAG: hypothetical protein HKP22_07395 [Gammaproteobacteria bacterium]|nr:hypothetical protein [Gammaproteobacteria bacterium]
MGSSGSIEIKIYEKIVEHAKGYKTRVQLNAVIDALDHASLNPSVARDSNELQLEIDKLRKILNSLPQDA